MLRFIKLFFGLWVLFAPGLGFAQGAKPAWQIEWEQTIEAAKKEGKVVISIPSSSELRSAIEAPSCAAPSRLVSKNALALRWKR